MFTLSSKITIDNTQFGGKKFSFSGINDVRIRRSIHSYADSAVLRIPSIAAIKQDGKALPGTVTTAGYIYDGAAITIELGYNKVFNQEFSGFVKSRSLDMPLEIVCEGYARLLRLNTIINKNYKSTTAKELLEAATKGTGIKVEVPDDIPLNDIDLNNNNGADVCDKILQATAGTVSIFFREPDTLWCGLIYTPYAQNLDPIGNGDVSYRLGYNVVKDNSLKEHTQSEPVQVTVNNKQPDGTKLIATSQITTAKAKLKKLLVHIPTQEWLQNIAQEKEYRINYQGYEGSINAFLQPYALPGYTAEILDARYPGRNGTYIIESTEVVFGQHGARRIAEIGPRLSGWADGSNNTPIN